MSSSQLSFKYPSLFSLLIDVQSHLPTEEDNILTNKLHFDIILNADLHIVGHRKNP